VPPAQCRPPSQRRRPRHSRITRACSVAKNSSANYTGVGFTPRAALQGRCCRRRCRRRSSFRRRAAARSRCRLCSRSKARPGFPARRRSFPICRTEEKRFRTAPRAARFKQGCTRHCERSEAIQHSSCRALDCFAAPLGLLAMTRMMANRSACYRRLALTFSSAAEPGHSSFSPSALSGASTVFKWPCRSEASSST
jgi:hypothetical protein